MKKVIVVSNCTTNGISRSLKLLCPELTVDAYDLHKAVENLDAFLKVAKTSDAILGIPQAIQNLKPMKLPNVELKMFPSFYFAGYHPDLCYVQTKKGQMIHTEFGAYHSTFCFTAFCNGLSVDDAIALYTPVNYEKSGYFSEWDQQRDNMISAFKACDIDIGGRYLSWVRSGCFMYSVNHPMVHCLFDLSRELAKGLGVATNDYALPPSDNLRNGAVFPCYPEIAEAHGAQGNYLFKLVNQDRVLSLREFVQLSYDTYSSYSLENLKIAPVFQNRQKLVQEGVFGRFGAI